MSQDDGSREIREGPYECGSWQATLAEKRVSLTLEFKIAFREITPETLLEMHPSSDPAGVLGDAALMGEVERQGRILRALLVDEEALRPVIEALGGEVAEYYEGAREEMFADYMELLIFSTLVKCLGVRGWW